MAASLVVEDERGTYTQLVRHPHNGYYAGDFSSDLTVSVPDGLRPVSQQPAWSL